MFEGTKAILRVKSYLNIKGIEISSSPTKSKKSIEKFDWRRNDERIVKLGQRVRNVGHGYISEFACSNE